MSILTPQHIAKGERTYNFDGFQGDLARYLDSACWGGSGCDYVLSAMPRHSEQIELPDSAMHRWEPIVPNAPAPTPEPGTACVFVGLMALAVLRRRIA